MTQPDIEAAAAELIQRTAVDRGLPRTVTDPVTLARLAVLFAPSDPPAQARSRRRRAAATPAAVPCATT